VGAAPPGIRRGLHFICVNANISGNSSFCRTLDGEPKFSGDGESDPLVGTRAPIPAAR
jgi:hypothetical protein